MRSITMFAKWPGIELFLLRVEFALLNQSLRLSSCSIV